MLKWVLRAEDGKGLPVAGGLLDQTQSFLDAWDFMAGEIEYWKPVK